MQRGSIRFLPGEAFDLAVTFANGQAFGWQQLPMDSRRWRGVLESMIVTLSLPPKLEASAHSSACSSTMAPEETFGDSCDFEVHKADGVVAAEDPPPLAIPGSGLIATLSCSAAGGAGSASLSASSIASSSSTSAPTTAGIQQFSADVATVTGAVKETETAEKSPSAGAEAIASVISSFLHAHVAMQPLVHAWAAADPRLSTIAAALPGMRILRQDPWECLISFVCSSNNNVPRIMQMLAKLRLRYGTPLGNLDGQDYYAFPSPEALAGASEEDLRSLGVGYRAKFIKATATRVVELGGRPWLLGLRDGRGHAQVHAALLQFAGVGPKVADCVAVFSCDVPGAIPVDTHVWAIACRDYDRTLVEAKSLTPRIYERVGDLFRARFGSHAGWAHSLLFAAELPSFRSRLPPTLQAEMEAFKSEEAGRKAEKRAAAAARKASRAAAASSEVTTSGDVGTESFLTSAEGLGDVDDSALADLSAAASDSASPNPRLSDGKAADSEVSPTPSAKRARKL